jgi:hypothetical protein
MTRRGKSDAQLDAEAAVRRKRDPDRVARDLVQEALTVTPDVLKGYLSDLHYDYIREGEIEQLTVSRPPITRSVIKQDQGGRLFYDDITEQEPGDSVGRSLSGPMVTLIGGIQREESGYGPHHPMRRALSAWERRCRTDHRCPPGRNTAWRDHLRGPICAEMAWSIVRDGTTLLWASQQAGVTFDRAERLLCRAVEYIRGQIARWEDHRDGVQVVGHDPERCAECRRVIQERPA